MDISPEDREYAVCVIRELADLLEAGASDEELRRHATSDDNDPPGPDGFTLVVANVGAALSSGDVLADLRRRAAALEAQA